MQDSNKKTHELGSLSETEKERADKANQVFRKVCEERGIKVSAWQDFSAWQKYVEGEIGEAQLTDRVKQELEDFTRSFGKYMVVEKQESKAAKEEDQKRERARLANAIYKKVCEEAGLTLCFFNNFGVWSDFVEGKIDEAEFTQKAHEESVKMAMESKAE